MEKKKENIFVYHGLGFPIHLYDFPMKNYWGEEMADIDYNHFKTCCHSAFSKKVCSSYRK